MKKIIFPLSLIIISAVACKTQTEGKDSIEPSAANVITLTKVQEKNATIRLGKLESNMQSQTLRAYGKTYFTPENIMSITSPYGGALGSIKIIQGQSVSKGQIIATLEDARFVDLQQEYLLIKSKLNLTQLNYERQKDLNQSKASSDKVYQLAENEYRSNQIMLKSLEEKLRLLGIQPNKLSEKNITRTIPVYSPCTGTIVQVNANKGKYILPSESIADVIDPSSPYLKLKIYEKDVPKLHTGMRLIAFSAHNSDLKYACQIVSIQPQISADGSTEALCRIIGKNKLLGQNQNLIADIELDSKPSSYVPKTAVVSFEGKSYIFIKIGDMQYKMISILEGSSDKEKVEILNSNEFAGKDIAIQGAYTLLMALKNVEV